MILTYDVKTKAPHFEGLYNVSTYRNAVLLGSRGSGKTTNVVCVDSLMRLSNPKLRTLILRDVDNQIEQSILYALKAKLNEFATKANMLDLFKFQDRGVITTDKNAVNNDLVITKGFRKSKTEQESDLRGFEDVDNFILEEVGDVRDYKRITDLHATARKETRKLFMISNSIDEEHWFITRHFDLVECEYPEFWRPIPKDLLSEGTYVNFSTYKDNPLLPESTRIEYDSYGDPDSYRYDEYTYCKDYLCLIPKNGVGTYFNLKSIKWGDSTDYDDIEGLHIFKHPIAGRKYAVGVDNASGVSNDYCSLHVIDVLTGEQVASANMKLQEAEWSHFVYKVANAYNQAYIAIERNEAGRVVVRMVLEDYHYPISKMFTHDTVLSRNTKFGFNTTSSTRPSMLAELRSALNEGGLTINCKDTYNQMNSFKVIGGKPQASTGNNDDLVMSLGIAWQCRQFALKFIGL